MKGRPIGLIVVLTATAVIIGGVLAVVYRLAEPKIEANRLLEEKRAIFAVLPEAKDYEVIEKTVAGDKGMEKVRIFKGFNEDGGVVGYAFIARGPGFQGIIKMMVGLHPDYLRLHGMQVLDQVETPGLGNKIVEDEFLDQFRGLEILPQIEYLKNKKPEKPNQIRAITGATISSKAVARIINSEAKRVVSILKASE